MEEGLLDIGHKCCVVGEYYIMQQLLTNKASQIVLTLIIWSINAINAQKATVQVIELQYTNVVNV